MSLQLLITLLGFFVFAHCQLPVRRINAFVDKQMSWHNRLLTPKYGLVPSDNFTVGGVELTNGVEIGMNSLYRTGDCLAVKRPQSTAYKYKIGYRLLVFAFANIRIEGRDMSGFFRIRNNSMQIDYTVDTSGGSCKVKLDEYRFIRFGNIEFGASDPDYDGKPVETFINANLLDFANSVIDKTKQNFENHLQPICKHPPKY